MKLRTTPFVVTDWSKIPAVEHPGERGSAFWRTLNVGRVRVRMVEYTAGYLADHWCSRGHILYVIEGELETELKGGERSLLRRHELPSLRLRGSAAPLLDEHGRQTVHRRLILFPRHSVEPQTTLLSTHARLAIRRRPRAPFIKATVALTRDRSLARARSLGQGAFQSVSRVDPVRRCPRSVGGLSNGSKRRSRPAGSTCPRRL